MRLSRKALSLLPENQLTRGRIWAEMYKLVGQVYVFKGPEFEKSYEHIARWLRRNLLRHDEVHCYIGKEALNWYVDSTHKCNIEG